MHGMGHACVGHVQVGRHMLVSAGGGQREMAGDLFCSFSPCSLEEVSQGTRHYANRRQAPSVLLPLTPQPWGCRHTQAHPAFYVHLGTHGKPSEHEFLLPSGVQLRLY